MLAVDDGVRLSRCEVISEQLPLVYHFFLLFSRADLVLSIIIFTLHHRAVYNIIVFFSPRSGTKTPQKHLGE